MFCPKCGNADQSPETFCRRCGTFLPDFEKPGKRKTTPEEHLKANTVLNFMTAASSLTLAILLYSFFLGRESTPVIIYVTAGFLVAMFGWQVQIIIRTFMLKNQLKKRGDLRESATAAADPRIAAPETGKLLNEPDFENIVPAGVTENTTRKLKVKSKK